MVNLVMFANTGELTMAEMSTISGNSVIVKTLAGLKDTTYRPCTLTSA
jgi:hypothetical protein